MSKATRLQRRRDARRMTRGEAAAAAATARQCGAQSKTINPSDPKSFMICTRDADCPHDTHTACNGRGVILAAWQSPAGAVVMQMPNGALVTL